LASQYHFFIPSHRPNCLSTSNGAFPDAKGPKVTGQAHSRKLFYANQRAPMLINAQSISIRLNVI
jgi:hypothetical protein